MRSPGTVVFFVLLVILLTMASLQYGLGRLPGDIVIDAGNFYFYLPITTVDHRQRAARRRLLAYPALAPRGLFPSGSPSPRPC